MFTAKYISIWTLALDFRRGERFVEKNLTPLLPLIPTKVGNQYD